MIRGAAVILLLAFALLSREARAGYVFYSASFGDWTVVCWSDSGAGGPLENLPGQKRCSLSAPPPVMEDTIPHSVGRSVISVVRDAGGSHTIALQISGLLAPSPPAFLEVDHHDAIQIRPNSFGEANLTGPEAEKLVRDMEQGSSLMLRSFSAAGKVPRDETIDLAGFAEALRTYGEMLSRFGAVSWR